MVLLRYVCKSLNLGIDPVPTWWGKFHPLTTHVCLSFQANTYKKLKTYTLEEVSQTAKPQQTQAKKKKFFFIITLGCLEVFFFLSKYSLNILSCAFFFHSCLFSFNLDFKSLLSFKIYAEKRCCQQRGQSWGNFVSWKILSCGGATKGDHHKDTLACCCCPCP